MLSWIIMLDQAAGNPPAAVVSTPKERQIQLGGFRMGIRKAQRVPARGI